MGRNPNRFRGLFYNGDWHTKLVRALKLAKEETNSNSILSTIEILEGLLALEDECIHTVTATQNVPPSMGAHFLLEHVGQCIDVEPATLNLAANGAIELTITARGNREHVLDVAKAILSSGLSSAKARLWVDTVLR